MTDIYEMLDELGRAEDKFYEALRVAFPVGLKVTYRLRGGKDAERYPWQEGEVVGYANDRRRLRVKLAPSRSSKYTGHERPRIETLQIAKLKRHSDILEKE